MEPPMCLIEKCSKGGFQVNSRALTVLLQIQQPVVVVSIVGMYRTGKSYLMNKLAGSQRGFDLGATVQGKTKGIWMWCLPHPKKENHTLVLLDTEGLGDVEGDRRNDVWIFVLAILLSSAFVYNSKGAIDEDAFEKLRYVREIVDYVKVNSGNENIDDDEADFSTRLPLFIWVVRDFTLQLNIEGKDITEDEYLENALKLKKSENKEDVSNKMAKSNKCRDSLRMCFRRRKCFTIAPPSFDMNVLHRMDEVSEENLSPRFVEDTQKFCEYIFDEAKVKHMDVTKEITGERLGHLLTMYIKVINTYNKVCMEDVEKDLSEKENKAAVQEATQHYEDKMTERVVFPTETITQFLELSKLCEDEALQIFINKSFEDKDHMFQTEFIKNIMEKKRGFSRMNEEESGKVCEELINKHSADLEKGLEDGTYFIPGGYRKFNNDINLVIDKYNSEPRKGIQATEVLQKFIEQKKTIRDEIMMKDQVFTEEDKEEDTSCWMENNELLEEHRSIKEKEMQKDQQRSIERNITLQLEKMVNNKVMETEILESVIKQKDIEKQLYASEGNDEQAARFQQQAEAVLRILEKKIDVKKEATSWLSWIFNLLCIPMKFFIDCLKRIISYCKEKFKNHKNVDVSDQ